MTSTASRLMLDIERRISPKKFSMLPSSPGKILIGPISFFAYPMNSIHITYSPNGISRTIKLPSFFDSPPVTTLPEWLSIIDTEAYSMGWPVVESVMVPCTTPIAGMAGLVLWSLCASTEFKNGASKRIPVRGNCNKDVDFINLKFPTFLFNY